MTRTKSRERPHGRRRTSARTVQNCVGLFALSIAIVSCRSAQQPGRQADRNVVTRAVDALGGADVLAGVHTLSVKGTLREWEPEQSVVADGEPRLASDSNFELVSDYGAGATRIDWVRNFHYPQPRTYTYSEIVTSAAGYVVGIDATARNKQSLESNPPAHTMSGFRLATMQRELQRVSPLLLMEVQRNPDRVSAHDDITVGGVSFPAVDYKVGDRVFTIAFDPLTGLPARVRSLDFDNIWGDVTYDVVLSDWRTVDKLRVAGALRYELAGRTVAEAKITDVQENVAVAADRTTIPPALAATATKPATGNVPYQWVIRRQFIGTYLDSDQTSYDARAVSGLHLTQVAPGVEQVAGGTHNSLIVEMRDHLIVFDAPISDWQSTFTLGAAHDKYPNKPVKYLVLTHHHMDHAGGLRAYAAQGVTIIVGKGNADHFRRVLAAPFQRDPDLSPRDLSKTPIVEVDGKHKLTDGTRNVDLYVIENPHAAGLLIGYVSDAKLGWVVDIWNPGRDPLPEKLTPPLAALVAGVRKAGITPVKFAGGHGSTADYAPLAALEAK